MALPPRPDAPGAAGAAALPPPPGALPPPPGGATAGVLMQASQQPAPTFVPASTSRLPPELANYVEELALAPDTSAANSATLIVGDTGSGKSELLRTAAEFCWETFGLAARLYAGDPGGFGTEAQSLMRLGILQAWRLRNHAEAFETAELASQGWWPEKVDALTGYADPDVRLIPPTVTLYVVSCPNGHVMQQVINARAIYAQMQCPSCATIVNASNRTVTQKVLRSPGFKQIGLYMFEGLTAWSSWVMNDMADRSGKDELGGEKGAINKIVSGNLILGSNNRAHYGFAQNRAEQWVINSNKIPGAVMPSIWTALELRASDEGGLPVFGPKIAGKAKTDEVPSWFGNCLHAENGTDERGKEVHRLWLQTHRHQHEGNIPHLAKHRSDPTLMPMYLEDPLTPEGTRIPFSGFSLNVFFRTLNTALASAVRKSASKYPNAPIFRSAIDMDAEEQEAALLLAKSVGGGSSAGAAGVALPGPVATIPGLPSGPLPAVGPLPPVKPMTQPAAQAGAVPQPAGAAGPVQTAPAAAAAMHAAVGQVAPLPPAVAPVLAQAAPAPAVAPLALVPPPIPQVAQAPPPLAPVQPTAPAAAAPAAQPLPPAQPVQVSGPGSAPVRPPAALPPPPPPGVPAGRKPAPAQVLPPGGPPKA